MRRFSRRAPLVVLVLAALGALVVLSRPNAVPYAPVLVALTLALLAATAAVQLRGVARNMLVTATTLCIGFAAIEAFFEAREPIIVLDAPGLWASDPDFGKRAARAGPRDVTLTINGKRIYAAVYTLDAALRRLTRSPADAPRARFFGDSFTFGNGVDDADTLPQAFADLTGMNVENYGFPGYSPAQALLAMQTGRFDQDLKGVKLIVLQTAPFHVDRTSCLPSWVDGAPRYVTVAGAPRLEGRCRERPWQSLSSYKSLLQPLAERLTRADVENYRGIVDAIIELARTKYKAPIFILDMERDKPLYLRGTGFEPTDLDAHFRATGATVLPDATSAPLASLRIPGDGHPNAVADRLLARELAEAAIKAGIIRSLRTAGAPATATDANSGER